MSPPELAARLAAAVGQSFTARSELATSLSSSWRAEPVGEAAALQGGAGAGKAFAFALRSGEVGRNGGPDAAEVGMLRAALWHADREGDVSTAMLFARMVMLPGPDAVLDELEARISPWLAISSRSTSIRMLPQLRSPCWCMLRGL